MYECYNHSVLSIQDKKADSVAIKGMDSPVMVYELTDGKAEINTAEWSQGEYVIQFFKGDQVISFDNLLCRQNLKYVSSSYDPRSKAKQILDAINAVLQGRASANQYHVKCGDKEIFYCSFDQLMHWKNYYEKIVAKEQGKPTQIRAERLHYRGI